LKLVVT